MGWTERQDRRLDTIWEIDDELWQRIEPILWEDAPATPKARGGRPRIDWRSAINGAIFRLRSGCQWNKLPERFGDDSSVHRWFQRGAGTGSSSGFGPFWWRNAASSELYIGVGKQQTVDWAKLDSAAKTWGKTPPTAVRTAPSSLSWSSVKGDHSRW